MTDEFLNLSGEYADKKWRQQKRSFLIYILDNCTVNEHTGGFNCGKCKTEVILDWFENIIECQGCDTL